MAFNAFVEPLSVPISQGLGLPRLRSHFSTVLLSFAGYQAIQWTSPFVFARLFPNSYGKASERVRRGWAVRTCSMVNALVVVPLALRCLHLPELDMDRTSGTHWLEGELEALALGFLWDAIEEALVHFKSIAFALHGIAVLFALALTFRPLFAYTSVRFLVMELSTPFVNIHWFLRNTGGLGSTFNTINNVMLVLVFFGARVCFGTFTAYTFMFILYEARDVPCALVLIYAVGTLTLQVLNWLWFYKILSLMIRRLSGATREAKKS